MSKALFCICFCFVNNVHTIYIIIQCIHNFSFALYFSQLWIFTVYKCRTNEHFELMYATQFSILLNYLCKNIFISNPDYSFWALKLNLKTKPPILIFSFKPVYCIYSIFLQIFSRMPFCLTIYSCLCILYLQPMYIFFREQLPNLINVYLLASANIVP